VPPDAGRPPAGAVQRLGVICGKASQSVDGSSRPGTATGQRPVIGDPLRDEGIERGSAGDPRSSSTTHQEISASTPVRRRQGLKARGVAGNIVTVPFRVNGAPAWSTRSSPRSGADSRFRPLTS